MGSGLAPRGKMMGVDNSFCIVDFQNVLVDSHQFVMCLMVGYKRALPWL